MRLSRYIAQAGIASRRRAEQLIAEGEIMVNGRVVREQGSKIDPQHDQVEYRGRLLQSEQPIYLMLYKPTATLCTVSDRHGRATVLELLPDFGRRLYPVGRLDYDTEGLLLLSNDGDFCHHIIHPRHHVEKHYEAWVRGKVSHADLCLMAEGLLLEDGWTAPAKVECRATTEDSSLLAISISEGRKRQIKRMCTAVGHPVLQLKRVGLAFLDLGGLKPGEYRMLQMEEVRRLMEL